MSCEVNTVGIAQDLQRLRKYVHSSLLMSWLVSKCVISMYLWIFQFFCNLQFQTIVMKEDTWYDLSLLVSTKTGFAVLRMIFLEECSMNICEECVFCCFELECSIKAS